MSPRAGVALAEDFRARTQGLSVPDLRRATQKFWREHQKDPQPMFSALSGLWAGPDPVEEPASRLGIVILAGPAAAAGVPQAQDFLLKEVPADPDWRIQEGLAKAFDWMCDLQGWEASLPTIDVWVAHSEPNVRRAASEGPRVWTKRAYFDHHPEQAVEILGRLRADESLYVRKSVANALSDISKPYPELVLKALEAWADEGASTAFVVRNAARHLRKTHPEQLPFTT